LELVGDDVAARVDADEISQMMLELRLRFSMVFVSTRQVVLRDRKRYPERIGFVGLARPLLLCDLHVLGLDFGLRAVRAKPEHTILVLAAADALCLGEYVLVDEVADLGR